MTWLLLAACDENETRLSYKELVGAASIFPTRWYHLPRTSLISRLRNHRDCANVRRVNWPDILVLFSALSTELSKYTDIDSFKSIELEKLPYLNEVNPINLDVSKSFTIFRVCLRENPVIKRK